MGTFFFTDPETTETYTYWHTLSRRDALPIGREGGAADHQEARGVVAAVLDRAGDDLHSIDVRGVLAGDGRGVIGLLRPAHRLGVAGDPGVRPAAGSCAASSCIAPATGRANRRVRCPRRGRCARAGTGARAARPRRRSSAGTSGTGPAWTGSCPAPNSPPAPRRSPPHRRRLPRTPPRRSPAAAPWPNARSACAQPAARTCPRARDSRPSAAPAAPGKRT